MKYIGQLSKEDAILLREFAIKSTKILEFGAGASTQIFAQCGPGVITTIEPNPEWISRTKMNLEILGVAPDKVEFAHYHLNFIKDNPVYDLIFVDGTAEERFPFAMTSFRELKVGGWMLFHDTRLPLDLRNFMETVIAYRDEVGRIAMNMRHSNISGFRRKIPEPYADWRTIEHQLPWQHGEIVPPNNWPDLLEDV